MCAPVSTSSAPEKLESTRSPLTAPFWSGIEQGVLQVQKCQQCHQRWFTPERWCVHCGSPDWKWVASPGAGTVYSFTVVHRPAHQEFPSPYVIAAIDLDDGWSMMSHVVDTEPADVSIGMRVRLKFTRVAGVLLPCFEPEGQTAPPQRASSKASTR